MLGIHIFEIYLIYVEYACKHGALHRETNPVLMCIICRPLLCNSGEHYIYVGDICLNYM